MLHGYVCYSFSILFLKHLRSFRLYSMVRILNRRNVVNYSKSTYSHGSCLTCSASLSGHDVAPQRDPSSTEMLPPAADLLASFR